MVSMMKLVIGFVCLVWGANYFVNGASALAKKLGVSSLIVGLTIVAFGTSAPELAVSVVAGVDGVNEIALGNVLGSNIFNLLVVAGMSAIIAPLVVDKELLHRDWVCSILATVVLFVFVIIDGKISRVEAVMLLLGFAILTSLQILSAKKSKHKSEEDEEILEIGNLKMIVSIIVGILVIVLGGEMTVSGATELALLFGMSEKLVGLTIVAIGTSLPEFVTSVVATRKKEYKIAIGNVIGSNLFNLMFILGITCLLNPIQVDLFGIYDILVLLVITVGIFFLAKFNQMRRATGVVLVVIYAIYTIWIVLR